MVSFGKIFWVNIICFIFYGSTLVLFLFWPEISITRFLFSISSLLIAMPLEALNLTCIFEKLFRQNFDTLEKIALTTLAALFCIPFLLSLEQVFLGEIFAELPLLNTLFLFFIAILYCPMALEKVSLSFFREPLFRLLALSALLYITLIFLIIYAYHSLPDSDPYYWFVKLQEELNQGAPTPLHLHRPLFSVLAYLFHVTGGLDFYAFFKYVLPFISLCVLAPAALVARELSSRLQQFVIFLLPLANASFILYLFIPIPQALFNISLIFFTFLLIYSWLTRKTFFYFAAGGVITITYFYHEVALFFFLPWVLITFITYRKPLFRFMRYQWLGAILLGVLLLSYKNFFFSFITFFTNWVNRIVNYLPVLKTNLTFPLNFINIDGRVVGWGNFQGVIQYYAFYVGPASCLAIVLIILYFATSWKRRKFWKEAKGKKEFWLLLSIATFFFILAEVFPRFLDIALLPERAWSIVTFLLLSFLVVLAKFSEKKYDIVPLLLIIALGINVSAALYVNNQKKYLVTEEQIDAAEWIKTYLPENKLFFSHGNWSVLKVYASTNAIEVPDALFYQDMNIFEKRLVEVLTHKQNANARKRALIAENQENLRELEKINTDLNFQELLKTLQRQNQEAYVMLEMAPETVEVISAPIYIFYSKHNSKNPYANRPYFQNLEEKQIIFDVFPERFQRIYESEDQSVVIWQLIK